MSDVTNDALWAEIYRLRATLSEIRDYDKGSKHGEGICPYGCDCPEIANRALLDSPNTRSSDTSEASCL